MKKSISFFVFSILMAAITPLNTFALEFDEVSSEAAILMDAQTGQILFDKNGDKLMYPASTTKIMTALVTLETCRVKEMAAVTETAIDIDEWDSSNIALVAGEEMSVDSLLYALMLPSANDAANVLAEHAAGSQSDFVEQMNQRALKIGTTGTHFANAHGLSDPEHYTTARDLALITREAIKNPYFMLYFGAATRTVPPTNLRPFERTFSNYDYMLISTSAFYDPRVIGGKVGYTHEAGHTMSSVAVHDGRTLICVVLKTDRDGKFYDTSKLFQYGFSEFSDITVPRDQFPGFTQDIVSGGKVLTQIDFYSDRDFKALIHKSADPSTVTVKYSHSDSAYNLDEPFTAYAEFITAPGDSTVPVSLGTVELKTDSTAFSKAVFAAMSIQGSLFNSWWILPSILALISLITFGIIFIVRQVSMARMKKRREERMEQLKRGKQALYSGPTPTTKYKQ